MSKQRQGHVGCWTNFESMPCQRKAVGHHRDTDLERCRMLLIILCLNRVAYSLMSEVLKIIMYEQEGGVTLPRQ